jgi:hypothetical protein
MQGNINDDAFNIHFSRPSRARELSVARRLGSDFIVNRAFEADLYSVWFARPSAKLSEVFGLDRELVVIYSNHSQTDRRVLKTLREVTSHVEYQDRVDHNIAFLIHNGDQREAIRGCQSPNWNIVVFRAQALLDCPDPHETILESITKYVRSVDLFGVRSPLNDDKYFFGRNDLVQQLVARGEVGRNNHSLIGLRKTGKTSVLLAAKRRLSARTAIVVHIDLQSNHMRRWWSLLEEVRKRCIEQIKDLPRTAPSLSRETYTIENANTLFADDMKSLLAGGFEQVVLMFDEIEYITPGLAPTLGKNWDQDFPVFWQVVRGVHQETNGGVRFVLAGVNLKGVEEPSFDGQANPIFQATQIHIVDPFDHAAVREMVEKLGAFSAITWADDVYNYLHTKLGGFPYLIRLTCSAVLRRVRRELSGKPVTIEDFHKNEEAIAAELRDPIADILLSFVWWFKDEYYLLEQLAAGNLEFFQGYTDQDPTMKVRLNQLGILRGGQLAVPAMAYYLRTHGDLYRAQVSPFSRTSVDIEALAEGPNLDYLKTLFDLRVETEIKLRALISMVMRVVNGFDNKRAAEAISRSVDKREGGVRPGDFFMGTSLEKALQLFYLRELGQIIDRNWSIFALTFGDQSGPARRLFNANMKVIKDARNKEAHTQDIAPYKMEKYREAYTWFLTKLAALE